MATFQKREKTDERRVVSHSPQHNPLPLPHRAGTSPNSPWVPPQQTQVRSASAYSSSPPLLAPLTPPRDARSRSQVGNSSSVSASSSPVTGSRPPTGSSSQPSQPSSPQHLAAQHTQALAVPGPRARDASPGKRDKRRSWFGGGSTKLSKGSDEKQGDSPAPAWIIGTPDRVPYDLEPLISAQRIPELWNERGNAYIYLFPRASGFGPSFLVDSGIFSSSVILTEQAYGRSYSVAGQGMSTASLAQARRRQMSSDYARAGSRTNSPARAYRPTRDLIPYDDFHDSQYPDNHQSEPIHLFLH